MSNLQIPASYASSQMTPKRRFKANMQNTNSTYPPQHISCTLRWYMSTKHVYHSVVDMLFFTRNMKENQNLWPDRLGKYRAYPEILLEVTKTGMKFKRPVGQCTVWDWNLNP